MHDGTNNAQEHMPSAVVGRRDARYAFLQNQTDKTKATQSYIVTWSSDPVRWDGSKITSMPLAGTTESDNSSYSVKWCPEHNVVPRSPPGRAPF